MTDEQIKQNALKAEKEHGNFNYQYQGEAFNKGYIVGAHSRDEEIEELKKKLEDITILKNFIASSLDIYDKDNKQLQDELNLIRNQWMSTHKGLPKKKDGKICSDALLVTLGQSWTVAEYHFGDKRWINLLGERETIEPEYWKEVNLLEEVLF